MKINSVTAPLIFLCLSGSLLLTACGNPFWLPPAHKIEIQQGNLLTEEQINSIKPGMLSNQVRTLIGEPVAISPFHTTRWDYAFTRGPAGSSIRARKFTVLFENDVVTGTSDNFDSESGERVIKKTWWQRMFPNQS